MANELKGIAAHSAEYFGDTRDHWWNDDFIATAARRLGLAAARDVLDVGCGVGHWTRLLLPELRKDARISGIDAEAIWVQKAAERASTLGLAERCRYEV